MNYTEDISRKSLRDVQSLGPIEISPSKKIKRTSGPKITIRPTRPPVVVCVCVFFRYYLFTWPRLWPRCRPKKYLHTRAHDTREQKLKTHHLERWLSSMCTAAAAVATGYVGGRYAPVPIVLQLVTCVNTLYTGTYEECVDDGRAWRGDFAIFNFFFLLSSHLSSHGGPRRSCYDFFSSWMAGTRIQYDNRTRAVTYVRRTVWSAKKQTFRHRLGGGEGRRRSRVRKMRKWANDERTWDRRKTGEIRNKDEWDNGWTFRDVPKSPVVHTCFGKNLIMRTIFLRPPTKRPGSVFTPLALVFGAETPKGYEGGFEKRKSPRYRSTGRS